jgi:transposase
MERAERPYVEVFEVGSGEELDELWIPVDWSRLDAAGGAVMEAVSTPMQETEVLAKATRRRFSAKEKKQIIQEADRCTKPGELGALLRREGIYSSYLSSWRQARDRGELEGLAPKKRGPKAKEANPLEAEVTELRWALAKSEARAKRAEALVEVQKKISQLLGIALPENDEVPS